MDTALNILSSIGYYIMVFFVAIWIMSIISTTLDTALDTLNDKAHKQEMRLKCAYMKCRMENMRYKRCCANREKSVQKNPVEIYKRDKSNELKMKIKAAAERKINESKSTN